MLARQENTIEVIQWWKMARNFRSVQGKMNNTSFNISEFIQPYYVVELLHRDDHDGFNDRQLFDVPPEIEVNYRDLETALPANLPSFKDVFLRVIDLHESPKAYIFGEDAMKSFIEYHDALNKGRSQHSTTTCGACFQRPKVFTYTLRWLRGSPVVLNVKRSSGPAARQSF